jgi:4-coumarate--CoA ligase (photoactive yellow protein activation family)
MIEILDQNRLEVFVNDVFWHTISKCKGVAFKGDLVSDLGLDSLEILDLASEFHFRFDMLSGEKEFYLLQYKTAELWKEYILKAANDPSKRFGFFTSGSSGKPKEILHDKHLLIQERDFWIDFTKAKGVVCLVPVRHIYGFIWGLLLGSRLKQAKFLGPNEWHKVSDVASENDVIVGHPVAWQQISAPFPHRFAISSTAPINRKLTEKLRSKNIKGINVYGSTETGAIAYQAWENEHFKLLPYWQKQGIKLNRAQKNYSIPDQLHWINGDCFKIEGRTDDVIQIGGENVSLDSLKEQLKAISGAREVWVKPYQSLWGLRLFSHFQIDEHLDPDDFEEKLKKNLNTLPSHMKPRKWEISHQVFNKLDL